MSDAADVMPHTARSTILVLLSAIHRGHLYVLGPVMDWLGALSCQNAWHPRCRQPSGSDASCLGVLATCSPATRGSLGVHARESHKDHSMP